MEYGHGGDVYTKGVCKNIKLIDFSSNINPLGVPNSFREHLPEALDNAVRYPDIKYWELKNNIVKYLNKDFNVKSDYLVLGNGASEIIDLTLSCFKSVLIPIPSFSEYKDNALKWNCRVEYSFLKDDMEFDYEDILSKLENVEAMIIGNPNNPAGNIIHKEKFKNILDYCEKNGKTIIIDEAFVEFTGISLVSFLKELTQYKCLFVIRAITKFFSLPGIRFGFGVSRDAELIDKIKGKQNPWNINCFAETAVKYILIDEEYIKASLIWIKNQRKFLGDKLREISFISKVYETQSNFILCKLQGINCDKLYDLCLERGIVIRRAGNFDGLDSSFIRLAIKDKESNTSLINCLSNIKVNVKRGEKSEKYANIF